MKHCPQCDFIYEDDQSVCDMDGKELVAGSATVATEQNFATGASAASDPVTGAPMQPAEHRWRSVAVATLVGFALAVLVVVYVARTYQSRSRRAPEVSQPSTVRSPGQSSTQSPSGNASGQPASSESVSQAAVAASLPEQSREPSTDLSSAQAEQVTAAASRESLAHTRLTPGPVSAAPSGSSRGPVIVRLTNGAAIRADEAWEKREGIWYRQGGVVTFLKRSQVRKIETIAVTSSRSNASNSPSGRTQNAATQKPLRLPQLEPATPKKQSRLTSFLKKTGQVLKKPFKL